MTVTERVGDLAALTEELAAAIGPSHVSTDLGERERASADWAKMSPILAAMLPLGLADVVARPGSAEEIASTVACAVRHGVPVTTRGKGTGNYGQAIPIRDGLVLDTSRANRITAVGDGSITAEAGTTFLALEAAARDAGQQLWMYPSTVGSSIGGFLSGGSGGTGTIVHGHNGQGFVVSVDVVHADGASTIQRMSGDDALPYLHSFGCAGVITRATVRTEPLQEWRAFYASFPAFEPAMELIPLLAALDPAPRLVSADTTTVVAALPADAGHPVGRASLRSILDVRCVDTARSIVETAGGRVEVVREGARACQRLSLLSYNHPTWHLQKAVPGRYFHLEVSGDALIDRYQEVDRVFAGSELHIEAGHGRPIGMLNGFFESTEQVAAGTEALRDLGVGVHSPHQWYVDRNVELVKATASRTDVDGLLNPGKLP